MEKLESLKPLQFQCVIAIRDGIEKGLIRSPFLLPPNLRPNILDAVLMHGTIDLPHCRSVLSSMEFLDGLTSLNTQRGNVDDSKYLAMVTESMSKKLPDGTTVGEGIKELKLNVYGCPTCKTSDDRQETTLAAVLQLIAKCPNLESLSLQSVTHMGKLDRCQHDSIGRLFALGAPEYLNDMASHADDGSLAILENLKSLQLIGAEGLALFLRGGRPAVEFRNLSSLTLVHCYLVGAAWAEFLGRLQNSLTSLVLEDVRLMDAEGGHNLSTVLPLAMPRLETFVVQGDYYYQIDQNFANSLVACAKMKRVKLSIEDGPVADQEMLSKLASFFSQRETEIRASHVLDHHFETVFDADSNFTLVKAFGSWISSFKLWIFEWNAQLAIALEHAMATCQNLESLDFYNGSIEFDPQIEQFLLRLFDNEERAMKLKVLRVWEACLVGEYSSTFWTAVFKNCLNLDTLDLKDCAHLNDAHLITWASGGGQLSELQLAGCDNISARGLQPVLANSAKCLRLVVFSNKRADLADQWRRVLDKCGFLENIEGCPEGLEDVIREHCHNMMHKISYNNEIIFKH